MGQNTHSLGFGRPELIGAVLSIVAIIAIILVIPELGEPGGGGRIARSMSNLKNFGTAHAMYAADWDGRQFTTTPDDLSELVDEYPNTYPEELDAVPSVVLGFDKDGQLFETRRGWAVQPFNFKNNCALGSFRAFNTQAFNQYLSGKVYDPIFWAPKDRPVSEQLVDYWSDPQEWPGQGTPYFYPSYSMAMSAMYDPAVYAGDSFGQTSALDLPAGHRSPGLAQARYPDLKTHMLEHHWLQNSPGEVIPGTGGVPWFFNLGLDSRPATLFYDTHVRAMYVREAVESDQRVRKQGGDSLVASNDPDCFGANGYFEQFAYEGQAINSYHIFTADGILGRDTTWDQAAE